MEQPSVAANATVSPSTPDDILAPQNLVAGDISTSDMSQAMLAANGHVDPLQHTYLMAPSLSTDRVPQSITAGRLDFLTEPPLC